MNRSKHIGLSLLALLCCILATASEPVTKYEYWLDQRFDSRQTITDLTEGSWDTQLDLSSLSPGLHRLAIRAGTDDGRWSAVVMKHFLIPQAESVQENTLDKYEYWIDKDFAGRVSGPFDAEGIVDMDIDFSSLAPGLHSIAFRALDKNGHASAVVLRHFLIPQAESVQENTLDKYEYWIDKDFAGRVSGPFDEQGVVDMDIDFSSLAPGLHSIAFRALDKNGHASAVVLRHFLIPQAESVQENTLDKYEYWIDKDFAGRVSGPFDERGIVDMDIDFSSLAPGLHSIAFRALDKNGHASAVVLKHFLIPQAESVQENTLDKYEYWIDKDFAGRVSGPFDERGIVDMDIDFSSLAPGLHSIAFRALDKNGHASAVVLKHFIIPQAESMQENAIETYEYWIDKNEAERVSVPFAEGGVIDIDVDLSTLAPGLHSITYQAKDKMGHYSPALTKYFIVPEEIIPDEIIAFEYWFNQQPRKRVEVEAANTVTFDADIDVEGAEPDSVLADYRFDVKSKQVIYTHDVIFGIQAFNRADVGSSAVIDTLKDHNSVIDVPFTTLQIEQESRAASPTGCKLQGYQFGCQPGDKVYWFMQVGSQRIDFYDKEGNELTADVDFVDEKAVLTITAPSDTIYALAYSAAEEGLEDTIRVTVPVELAFENQERKYGEEDPTFTYVTSRPDLLAGTPVGKTEATATSGVGEYTISLDESSISNTLLTVTEGTLTINKAELTITANDAEMYEGDALPKLTWQVSGLKNGESAEDVFSAQPTCKTQATSASPAGLYDITVDGAEAENYSFTYVAGHLSISTPTGILTVKSDGKAPGDIYTLLGKKVRCKHESIDGLPTGVYVTNGRKILIKN